MKWIVLPAVIMVAGSIMASVSPHPGENPAEAEPAVDVPDSTAYEVLFLPHADPDSILDLDDVELPFRRVVDDVPEVDPSGWADTALYRHRDLKSSNRYKRLTHDDYAAVAEELGVEPAAIKAVVDIEAGSTRSGFWKPGWPLINFDLSMFQQFGKRRGVSLLAAQKMYPVIFHGPDKRRYGSYQAAQYARLEAATAINSDLGAESCFWGMFQIGGFNWQKCGCRSIGQFVELMSRSERDQLELFARFIESCNLVDAVRSHDWERFALRYNGPKALERGYHTRMASAYKKNLAAEKRSGL